MQREVYSLARHRLLARSRQDPCEEQMVVQALSEHRVDLSGGVGDEEALPGVPGGLAERLDDAVDTLVDVLNEADQQREHADDNEDDHEAEADGHPPPRDLLGGVPRHRGGGREMRESSNHHSPITPLVPYERSAGH